MLKNQISFFISPARSGKSTHARAWEKDIGPNPRVVVNADAIRLELHGSRYNSFLEGWVSELKHLMIRKYYRMGYDVLVDGTHTSEKSIRKILQVDPEAKPILIGTTPTECIRRAHDSGQSDLERPILRMFENMSKTYNDWCGPDYQSVTEIENQAECIKYNLKWFPFGQHQFWDYVVRNISDTIKPIKRCIV